MYDDFEPETSDCCDAPIIGEDICSDCGEHCGIMTDEDRKVNHDTAIGIDNL